MGRICSPDAAAALPAGASYQLERFRQRAANASRHRSSATGVDTIARWAWRMKFVRCRQRGTSSLIANDAERVASFMIGDWVYVGPDGVTPKSEIIEWITSGRLRHDRMTSVGPGHLVHAGGTIVLTARTASAGAWEGNPYTADEWITEAYVQTSDGWRCALSHKTPATRIGSRNGKRYP
jgi:ketosteroid isomerase-like protein